MTGAPVSWRSTRQTSISKSTTKAEYISGSETSTKLIWMNNMLADTGLINKTPAELRLGIKINMNNKDSINLANKEVVTWRSKHIKVCYYLI